MDYPLDLPTVPDHLAEGLERFHGRRDAVILGIPESGSALAVELGVRLRLTSELLFVAKEGGWARGEDGPAVSSDPLETPCEEIESILNHKLRQRTAELGNPPKDLKRKTAIIVDDAVVSGLTMLAAVQYACRADAAGIVVVTPLILRPAVQRLKWFADELVTLRTVDTFHRSWDGVSTLPDQDSLELVHMWNQLCWRRQGRRNYRKRRFGEFDTPTLEKMLARRLSRAA